MIKKETHGIGQSSLVSFVKSEIADVLFFGFLDLKNENDFSSLVASLKLHAQNLGLHSIVGPINESTYLDYRLKLNFFEDPPYVGEPVNSPGLAEMFSREGFKIKQKYFSHEFKILNQTLIVWLAGMGLISRTLLFAKGYRLVPLKAEELLKQYRDIHQIVHEIFSANFLYSPISDDQFLDLIKNRYVPSLDEKSSLMLMDPQGKCVGFSLCLIDQHRVDRVLFKALGVKRGHRQKGLASLGLMSKTWYRLAVRFKNCLACLTIQGSRVDDHFREMSYKHYEYGLFELKF